MNDMNFFAPFSNMEKGGKHGNILKVFLILILATIVILPAAIFGYTYSLNGKAAEIAGILNKPENVAIMKELDAKQTRLDAINKALPELKGQDKALKDAEWFSEEVLQIIVDATPKQIRMTGITLGKRDVDQSEADISTVEITGISTDKPAVSEIEYNLRKTGRFDNLFVSTMTDEEGVLNFSIKFDAKEVSAQ